MPLLVKRKSVLDLHSDRNTNARPSNRSDPSLKPSNSSASSLHPHPHPHTDPARPQSEYGPSSSSHSRLSHEIHPDDIPDDPTDDEARPPTASRRFNLMKFRNYSESHLAARAKLDEQRMQEARRGELPPVPAVTAEGVLPTIVKTAPTMGPSASEEQQAQHVEDERNPRPSLFKRASSKGRMSPFKDSRRSTDEKRQEKKGTLKWRRGKNNGLEDLHRLSAMNVSSHQNNAPGSAPPSYGDESNSALAVPVGQLADPRFSESSRSDGSNGSSGDGHIYGSTTTTTHTVSTHTTFFKLPRRNKNRNSLFPLPVKIPPPNAAQQHDQQGPATPRASTQSNTPEPSTTPRSEQQTSPKLQRRHTAAEPPKQRPHSQSVPSSYAALTKNSLSFAEPGMNLFRRNSQRSQNSNTSSPLQPPMALGLRDRSSTTSSFGRSSHEPGTPPTLSASGRNSTSTTGRSSFGGFLTLSRFRQSSEPHSPRHGSPGTRSKSNSFALSREALVIPEREEGDTPGKYLERLESAVSRSVIAGILSKSSDPFASAVLRSYTRRFPFFGEPIDMSLRKFLLEAELPKETQQVDRVIQAFADRYHECNPGIFTNSDQAYVIAFSIMMLHTDAFNKNNKRKMTKQDYIKNTSGQGLADDILACFYDNICYTPFVHYDEDVDINGEKVLPFKTKKSGGKLKSAIPGSEVVKKSSGPVDPYNLLVEQKLDALRPPIKESIMFDDPYDYRGNQGELDPQYLQKAFTHTGVLQIISARSRPAAYESQFINGQPNPTEDQQGIVDLKITKVGTLWRKSTKKKKTRSPWQEWGAILTGSQLYLFKNSHWAKGLMHQFLNHQKPGHPRTPVVFKPPLTDFKFDALIKTDNAVALVDHSYARHKHAFTFVRPGGQDEVLLADNENELNDWLGLINYAAAFRAAGVRIRGMLGGTEEDLRNRDLKRLDSTNSTRSIQTAMGEVTVQNRGLSPQLHRQVMAARRQIMVHKIGEIEKEIADANRQLENMLRNARHLLVLSPIAPKAREDVIHSAAKVDAMIKWMRRDIWRLKAHRDILAMDVRLDGLSASELEKIAQEESRQQQQSDSARKEKPKMLSRLSSTRTGGPRSPPQSPTNMAAPRPSTGSIDTPRGQDVFKTPPESVSPQKDEPWRLPPLSLDSTASMHDQHRPSVASTLLSASPPPGHRGSLAHSSSASSVLQAQRTHSSGPSESGRGKITPTPSINEKDLELLARSTMGPAPQRTASRGPSIEIPNTTSPESKHKGVRRSLQKTLRDAHHHHHGSMHKHRRNKDSDSTVRSAGVEGGEADEATPGLQRDKPRFILHGKQASVVQFGGDWERMKLRREQYESQHPSSPTRAGREAEFAAFERRRSEQHELFRAGMMSPAVQEFGQMSTSIDEDEDDDGSMLSVQSFREDAEAAAAYSATEGTSSPVRFSSDDGGPATDSEMFDLSRWDHEPNKRTTVIGPSRSVPSKIEGSATTLRHRRFSSLEKDADGNIQIVDGDSCDEEEAQSPTIKGKNKHNRRTVIGPIDRPPSSSAAATPHTVRRTSNSSISSPASSGKGKGKGKARESPSSVAAASRRLIGSRGSVSTSGGAPSTPSVLEEERELESEHEHDQESDGSESSIDGERGFVDPISDEELRAMSEGLGK